MFDIELALRCGSLDYPGLSSKGDWLAVTLE